MADIIEKVANSVFADGPDRVADIKLMLDHDCGDYTPEQLAAYVERVEAAKKNGTLLPSTDVPQSDLSDFEDLL